MDRSCFYENPLFLLADGHSDASKAVIRLVDLPHDFWDGIKEQATQGPAARPVAGRIDEGLGKNVRRDHARRGAATPSFYWT